jgi:prophage tail gpP-like protein
MNETIYDAADRHLRRHGLLHWDSPDGKIVVGAPNDDQDPLYQLRYRRTGDVHLNNVLSANRTQDWSGIPSAVVVHGRSGKPGRAGGRITAFAKDSDVYNAGFYRPLIIVADGIRKQALADHAAKRELAARSKNKDAYTMSVDGLSYWDGYSGIQWGIDTTCAVDSDTVKLAGGVYYIFRTEFRRDAQSGDVTNISAVRRGIWVV